MDGIEILRVWTPNLSSQSILNRVIILLVFSILSSIVLFTREYDVIVGAGAPSPMIWNIPFCFQSFLRNTPLVLTENDSVPNTLEGFMPRIRGAILWTIITHLSRLIESSASHIITYTEEIKQLIVSRGILPEKITVIPLPLDTSLMRPISDGVMAIKKEIFQGKFTVMYSGALTPSYDLVSLLKAASELSDEEILFVIRGWGPLFSLVKKHIEEENLLNVILLQKKLAFKELVVLYNAVDLFVIPLQDIPVWSDVIIPTKLSDFIACGKPVVVSSGRATMRLIKKNKIGEAVPMGRSDLLAKAILRLYRNRDLLASMGNRARLFALEYCGIDKVTEKLEEVLIHIRCLR